MAGIRACKSRLHRLRRVTAIGLAMLVLSGACVGLAAATGAPSHNLPIPADLQAFARSFWPQAEASGIARPLFDSVFKELLPDPSVAALTRHQPEFARPIGAYLAAQVTPARVAQGRAMLTRWQTDLAAIEARYQVPAAILVAVWGMETGYGAATGGKDVIRSMATLAAMNYRPQLYRAECLAALTMLQNHDIERGQLRGSWAGAMGLPQFMPSSFAKFAVDQDGDGRKDIWTSVPDALASIANFLRMQGWQPQRPWGFEVTLPRTFDDHRSRAGFADWAALGLSRPDAAPLPAQGDATLFFPSGAEGPALLVTENFEVLKTYNFSDAYVLSVGLLADRMTGGPSFQGRWPQEIPMSREDRIALQTRLTDLGFPVDNREGRISLALRDVIRAAQARVGMVSDGNPTAPLLHALLALPSSR